MKLHDIYIGLGSNLGDRQSNILAALQRLRAKTVIEVVSSFFESEPAEGAAGPSFLNVAAHLRTELDRPAFIAFAKRIEIAVGRASSHRHEARPVDIDVLYIDTDAHPDLSRRNYNLIPLAEIAPDLLDPRTHKTLGRLAGELPANGIHKKLRGLHFNANRQEEPPEVRLSLNRVGVCNLRRVVHLNIDGRERVFNGQFTMVADLQPDKAGVHMSRFTEILEGAALDVLAREEHGARIEDLVQAIASEIVRSHKAARADVRLKADFGLERWTPVSGKRGEETYTLIGIAHADPRGSRRVVGVEAEGMTACPCAQLMMREHSHQELVDAGFSAQEAQRALDALPAATHNQRGRGTLMIGNVDVNSESLRAEDLVEIVENAMSSETYDLLKRPDEFFIVNKAHHNPKFVEDVVRGILARALEVYEDFPDGTFISATQVNFESIHKHDAFAEGFATFGELREELRSGRYVLKKTDLAAWLGTRFSAALL
ncbi:MAG: GTP cyclohydrolase MptA [Candidatus Eremiobacteraeota bacterium]|nr:GTP cyclohydrolase MptA [Candidatus Eremiobacteraeota bacterium]